MAHYEPRVAISINITQQITLLGVNKILNPIYLLNRKKDFFVPTELVQLISST